MCILTKVKDCGTMDVSAKILASATFFREGQWLAMTSCCEGDAFSKALLVFPA